MNCELFKDFLPEYLDDALSPADQADVREHIQKCDACRQALARQEAFAKSIRLSMQRQTEGLSLSPETRQNILNAFELREPAPTAWGNFRACLAAVWRRPALACAAIVCLALLGFGAHFYRQNAVRDIRCDYVIDVPVRMERYVYRAQNDAVVDAVVTGAGVMDANFSENITLSSSPKSHLD